MAKTCTVCGKRSYSEYCVSHKPRKPIKTNSVLKTKKRPKQQSDKEKEYQVWKEQVARPALIERDGGNYCTCCGRPAYNGEKLDIEHTLTKGSRPDLKRDLDNLTLMCRYPCHFRKTNGLICEH